MDIYFFAALEVEKISWWLWVAKAYGITAYGNSDRIAIDRLEVKWNRLKHPE